MTDTMIKYLCSNCKGKCDKDIRIIKTKDTVELKCYDYRPDKSKIHGYVKPLQRTARLERTVMGFNSPDWS